MRPSAAPLRSLRLPRASTSAARRFAVSRPTGAQPASTSTSASAAQPFTPPIEPGVLPAYDLCLQYLRETAESKRTLVPALEEEIERLSVQARSKELSAEERADCQKELKRLRKRVWTFRGGADRFDPQVRYEFRAGLGACLATSSVAGLLRPSRPFNADRLSPDARLRGAAVVPALPADPSTDSFRYLDQERFELEGTLDVHIQNLNIMHVVPDVCNPGRKGLSVDLILRFPAPPPKPAPVPDELGWIKSKSDRVVVVRDEKDGNRIVVGSKLTVGEVRPQPEVEIRYFSADAKFGTLVMVDPGTSAR
jgi:hypothetical protein